MNYKIKSFFEETGQIVVQFDEFQPIAIDLPLNDDASVITGEFLETYIQGFAPRSLYERKQKLASNGISNASEIRAMVEEQAESLPEPEVTTEQKWNIIRSQRDMLLYDSDWTQLDDVPLSVTKKQQWATYRTDLRNITSTYTSPDLVVFPTKP